MVVHITFQYKQSLDKLLHLVQMVCFCLLHALPENNKDKQGEKERGGGGDWEEG